jgi:hypothetical protein
MKKIMIIACALVVVAISATAAQKNINTRDIEHPRLLEAALDNNFDELYAADVNLGTNAVAASRLTGNIESARLTNAISAVALVPNTASYTNVIVSKDDKTNTIIVIKGQIISWTIGE